MAGPATSAPSHQGLAAGMEGDDPLAGRGEPLPARPEDAGRMRLVDDQHRVVPLGHRHQVGQGRGVAVHRIEAFDRDPRGALAALLTPSPDRRLERGRIVVDRRRGGGARQLHPLMHTGMDQRVMDDQVAALRQRRQQRGVGGIAGGEIEARLRAEEGGSLGLQRLMLGMVAAQQPRSARADGNALFDRVCDGGGEARVAGEAQIVVGGEVPARHRGQPPQSVPRGQSGQIGAMKVQHGGFPSQTDGGAEPYL